MTAPPQAGERAVSGIRILEARVCGFRSLKLVSVLFDDLTLLIGENNSGKTSFLEALCMAIGHGNRSNHVEDIFLAPGEQQPPKERKAIIDLLIRPVDSSDKIRENFPQGSPWLELWGNGIMQDAHGNDFVGIRTTLKWDVAKGEYGIFRHFLSEWTASLTHLEKAKINEKSAVLWSHVEPLALYFMDAKRDIHDDLRSRSSFWNKLVSDIGLTDAQILDLEIQLNGINDAIVANSKVLTHIQAHLGELYHAVNCEKQGICITPLNRHLRDFRQGMDVQFATSGSQSFPLSRHGMGTRSLAAVLIFRAYMTWRQKQSDSDNALHPMLALEEPESHLHPQAQRALFSHLDAIPGQRLISSHSPYIVSQADIKKVRHFRKTEAETLVSTLDTTDLEPEDIRKINRMVLNTRGDILFAKAIVLFEGETEEQALPVFAEHYWQRSVHALGLSFVGVSGGGNYLPFLRLAHSYGIPWFILADGEAKAQQDVASALSKIGITNTSTCQSLFVIPNGEDYEAYMVSQGYQDAASSMLNTHETSADYVSDYMSLMQGQKAKGGKIRDYTTANGRDQAIVDILSESKTEYGAPLARSVIALVDETRQVPKLIRDLFVKMSEALKPIQQSPEPSESKAEPVASK